MSYQFPISHNTDETILESYIESLVTSSFPNEIRRVLEHLRYLNNETDRDVERWREMQDGYLDDVKRGVLGIREDFAKNDGDSDSVGNVGETSKKRKRDDKDVDEGSNKVASMTPATQIPTTEQIISQLLTNNPQLSQHQQEISTQHARLKQLSAERIQTAHQLRHMVDMALGRLNRDLEVFERELGIVHEASDAITSASLPMSAPAQQPAAAPARVPPSTVPKLDKAALQTLDKSNNSNKNVHKSNLRRASTTTSTSSSTHHPASLSRSNSVALPISQSAGTFTQRPKDLAAIQVTPDSTDWILAKILSFDKSTKTYTLSDEDIAEDKVYTIPSSRVIPLSKGSSSAYSRGDNVYAVYPDTTSFYLATVSTCKGNFVMVHFRDDGDEFGVTHEKAVPVWLVMKVPGKSGG